jgi:glycosyltransferase involved in cell wall biosynthesis
MGESGTMQNKTTQPGRSRYDKIAILIPVFNDWESLPRLLPGVDAALGAASLEGHVTVVDDGSTVAAPDEFRRQRYSHLPTVEVMRLRCNLGHQRAIAVGMAHLSKIGVGAKAIVIMDGDGEDRPEDIPRLVAELPRQPCDAVFAARTTRTEGYTFRLMYFVYRLVFWFLTGAEVRVGNFSALSCPALSRLVVNPDVWNHYAATVLRSRMRFSTLPLPRGKRYLGGSHMRYSTLVAHGLSAVAVFSEVVGARLVILFSGVLAILLLLFGIELFARLFTAYAIPGWAAITTGVLILFTMQALLSMLIFALNVLGRRSQAKIVPLRDVEPFIESVVRLNQE